MDIKAEEEGVSMTKTTATTTSLIMPSAEAKLGLQVEDLWDVQAPQLDPADKLNTCFEEIPVFSFPMASFSSVEIDSESSLAEAVRVLAKHMLLSDPVVDAHAPKDASWVDRYIGVEVGNTALERALNKGRRKVAKPYPVPRGSQVKNDPCRQPGDRTKAEEGRHHQGGDASSRD